MIMFKPELAKYFKKYRYGGNPDQKKIGEEELNRIVMIMGRVSEDYDCSTSSGFTYCEQEFARLLLKIYEAGIETGKDYAKREIV